jgi:integrase
MKLDKVRPVHLEELIGSLQEKSWSLRRDIVTILRGVFGSAVANFHCAFDPPAGLTPGKKAQKEIKVFKRKQVDKILDFARSHKYGHYIALLLHTGMRIGEAVALKWSDIDDNIITVRSAITIGKHGYEEKGTKTNRERHIGVDSELRKILNDIPKQGLYVLSERGARLYVKTFERRYKKFFEDLNATLGENEKIPYLSPHKCRHTFGTHLLKGGASICATQTLLGHTQVTTTQRYTHVDIDDLMCNIRMLGYGNQENGNDENRSI